MAATISRDSVVAGQCLRADQIEYTQFVGELPYFALVAVHQRCVDHELFVHGQVERHIERTDKRVTAIRVSAEIGFRNARNEMKDTFAPCHNSGKGKEYHVSARDECVWITVSGFVFVHRDRRVR